MRPRPVAVRLSSARAAIPADGSAAGRRCVHLQRLRHVLADLRQPVRSAARAGRGRRHHHTFARQMLGERLAQRLAADEPLDLGAPGRGLVGRQFVLRRVCREFIKRGFQLVEKTLLALRPSSAHAPAPDRRPTGRRSHGARPAARSQSGPLPAHPPPRRPRMVGASAPHRPRGLVPP